MSGIKKINVINDEGNPVKITDLQNLWEACMALGLPHNTPQNGVSIISGFQITGNTIGSGVVSYNSQIYYFTGGNLNDYLYVRMAQEDQRVTQQGQQVLFYTNYIAVGSLESNNPTLGTMIGQMTSNILGIWKTPYIPIKSLNANVLIDDSVTARQLGTNCVRTENITPRSVTKDKLADNIQWGTSSITPQSITPPLLSPSLVESQFIIGICRISLRSSQGANIQLTTTNRINTDSIRFSYLNDATIPTINMVFPSTTSYPRIFINPIVNVSIASSPNASQTYTPITATVSGFSDTASITFHNITDAQLRAGDISQTWIDLYILYSND